MPRRNDFPDQIPEWITPGFTPRQLGCVFLYVEDGMTQELIGRKFKITRQAVAKHLDIALAKINGTWVPTKLSAPLAIHRIDESKLVAWA